jgi:hypothetical protein
MEPREFLEAMKETSWDNALHCIEHAWAAPYGITEGTLQLVMMDLEDEEPLDKAQTIQMLKTALESLHRIMAIHEITNEYLRHLCSEQTDE